MPTPAEGRKAIKMFLDNVRNFFPALLEADKWLAAMEEAAVTEKNLTAQVANLTAQVGVLEKRTQEAALAESQARERAGVVVGEQHKLEAEYRERRALLDKYGRAEELDALLAEKQAALDAITAAFNDFKAAHNLG